MHKTKTALVLFAETAGFVDVGAGAVDDTIEAKDREQIVIQPIRSIHLVLLA